MTKKNDVNDINSQNIRKKNPLFDPTTRIMDKIKTLKRKPKRDILFLISYSFEYPIEYRETANETIPINNIKNAEIPSTKISRLKNGITCGTSHDSDLVVITVTENKIVKIEPIMEGMKIRGRENLPFLDIKPSMAPPRNNDTIIWNKIRFSVIFVSLCSLEYY
jgi:hypothetical protein